MTACILETSRSYRHSRPSGLGLGPKRQAPTHGAFDAIPALLPNATPLAPFSTPERMGEFGLRDIRSAGSGALTTAGRPDGQSVFRWSCISSLARSAGIWNFGGPWKNRPSPKTRTGRMDDCYASSLKKKFEQRRVATEDRMMLDPFEVPQSFVDPAVPAGGRVLERGRCDVWATRSYTDFKWPLWGVRPRGSVRPIPVARQARPISSIKATAEQLEKIFLEVCM
jgi:hypothetical protein